MVDTKVVRPGEAPRSAHSSWRRRLSRPWLLLVPALLFLTVLFVAPLVRMVIVSFTGGETPLEHYQRAVGPVYLNSLENTLVVAFSVTVICLLLAYPTAYVMVTAGPVVKALIAGLIILPYFIAGLVRTYAVMVVLGRKGPINQALLATGVIDEPIRLLFTRWAVIAAMTLVLLPMMVLALYSVMSRIDPSLTRAAQGLGASPASAFWSIFVPLSLPGAFAGIVLVFVVALGFFITPALVGGAGDRVLAQDIAQQSALLTSEGFTEALGVILLVATLGVLAVSSKFVRFDHIWSIAEQRGGDKGAGAPKSVAGIGRRGFLRLRTGIRDGSLRILNRVPPGIGIGIGITVAVLVAASAVIPILIVVFLSFSDASFLRFPPETLSLRWYREFMSNDLWKEAAVTSLVIGILTALFAVIVGTMAAFGLSRMQTRGKSLIVALLLGPLIVPAVVGAMSLYWILLRMDISGSIPVLVAVHALGAVPMVAIIVAATLQTFDIRLEIAAQSLGASKWTAIRLITLPLIKPGLFAAALFAFLYSFDELVYTLILVQPGTVTLPLKLWGDLNFGLTPILAVVSSLEIVVVVTIILLSLFVQRTRTSPRAKQMSR